MIIKDETRGWVHKEGARRRWPWKVAQLEDAACRAHLARCYDPLTVSAAMLSLGRLFNLLDIQPPDASYVSVLLELQVSGTIDELLGFELLSTKFHWTRHIAESLIKFVTWHLTQRV